MASTINPGLDPRVLLMMSMFHPNIGGWGGYGTGGPTGGGIDDPSGGRGPGRGDPGSRGRTPRNPSAGVFINQYTGPQWLHSLATPALRKAGYYVRDADQLIRLARQGKLILNPETYQIPGLNPHSYIPGYSLAPTSLGANVYQGLKAIEDKWNARRARKGQGQG